MKGYLSGVPKKRVVRKPPAEVFRVRQRFERLLSAGVAIELDGAVPGPRRSPRARVVEPAQCGRKRTGHRGRVARGGDPLPQQAGDGRVWILARRSGGATGGEERRDRD